MEDPQNSVFLMIAMRRATYKACGGHGLRVMKSCNIMWQPLRFSKEVKCGQAGRESEHRRGWRKLRTLERGSTDNTDMTLLSTLHLPRY